MKNNKLELNDSVFLETLIGIGDFSKGILNQLLYIATDEKDIYKLENMLIVINGGKHNFQDCIADPEKLFLLGFDIPYV